MKQLRKIFCFEGGVNKSSRRFTSYYWYLCFLVVFLNIINYFLITFLLNSKF